VLAVETESWGNVAVWDRLLRVLIGVVAVLGARQLGAAPAATVAIEVLGIAMLATAVLGWDPIYALLRRGTRA
jgi:hypothetical protein